MTCPICGIRAVTLPDFHCHECRTYLAAKACLVLASSTRRTPTPTPKPKPNAKP